MTQLLDNIKVAFLVANEGVEQVELTSPRDALEAAGAITVVVSLESGRVQAFNHLDPGDVFHVDVVAADARVVDFDALVLPGGVANPDQLRMDSDAVDFVRGFFDAGKPVAVICHGPWTLIEADVVQGRRLTSWPSLQTDLRNAGAEWVDEEVVVDRNGPNVLVSSRKPDDLPAFDRELIQVLATTSR
ncbi:MAG: type 1 glutamine amidotransferase domain-containing protein [Ilumatobacteraceae bacterium]